MGLRSFTAPDGAEWQVWAVVPESRYPVRRVRERRGQDVLKYTGPERRKGERRRTPPMGGVPAGYAGGWLCFQSGDRKRRLAPVPDGWETRADAGLVELWRNALPAGAAGAPDRAAPT
ncbi:MAG: hypothetical protein AB1941_05840 [Gemmatimonadota bacterium]